MARTIHICGFLFSKYLLFIKNIVNGLTTGWNNIKDVACRQLIYKATSVTKKCHLARWHFSTVYERHTKAGVIECGLNDHHFVFTIMPYKNNTGQAEIASVGC